ncbi:MAG: sulfatase [Phycisphaerae bacterium]|nr:sulfatase [Phycisphaerae bacterium]
MNRRTFLKNVGAAMSVMAIPGCASGVVKTSNVDNGPKLNFIFFLVDDLGWADLGCYGSKFYETPNIDRLAAQGMKFTDAYADCPVCSPTRASIMSGKYSTRLNITNFDGLAGPSKKLKPPKTTGDLPLEELTIAEAMKQAGYTTYFAGKWHIGHEEKYHPQHQGFDINIAGHRAGQPGSYYYPYKHPVHTWSNVPGLEDGKPGEYLTNRLADESVKFLDTVGDKPFFLYHCFYSVHTPIEPRKDLAEKYKSKLEDMPKSQGPSYITVEGKKVRQVQDNPDYAAMVAAVDESIGRILSKVDQLGLGENTAIIFMSDNGGLFGVTSNLPLRAGKAWLYEGGIREPMIVKWPSVVKESSVCNQPVISTDFYPTILEMAGLKQRPSQHLDGVSLVPLLKGNGNGKLDREAIFWHYPHYHSLGNTPAGAVRSGDYKLIEFYEDFNVELYNLKDDIGEKNNLAEKMPQKVNELRDILHKWRKEVNAQMPTPNPGYKPK